MRESPAVALVEETAGKASLKHLMRRQRGRLHCSCITCCLLHHVLRTVARVEDCSTCCLLHHVLRTASRVEDCSTCWGDRSEREKEHFSFLGASFVDAVITVKDDSIPLYRSRHPTPFLFCSVWAGAARAEPCCGEGVSRGVGCGARYECVCTLHWNTGCPAVTLTEVGGGGGGLSGRGLYNEPGSFYVFKYTVRSVRKWLFVL